MRRWLAILAALLFVIVLTLAVLYMVFVHPWLAMPRDLEQIEIRWSAVEQWARQTEACEGSTDLLVAAVRSMEAVDPDVVDAMVDGEPWSEGDDRGELPAELEQALSYLMQWHAEGGGVDPEALEEQAGLLQTYELGRAAMAAAPHVEDARVDEAVLRFGWIYRECGMMIHGAVGFELARLAVEYTEDRGAAPTQAYRDYRPRPEQVFGIAAREAVFTHELCSTELSKALQGTPALEGVPGFLPPLVDPERELVMLRQFWGDRMHAASADPSDNALLVEQFHYDDPGELPTSLLVRIIGQGTEHLLQRLAEQVEEYDAFLARAGGA